MPFMSGGVVFGVGYVGLDAGFMLGGDDVWMGAGMSECLGNDTYVRQMTGCREMLGKG